MLTNRTVGLDGDFNGCLATYESDDECAELARFYVANPDEAARIAARGRVRVLKEHTFTHRVEEIVRRLKF